MSDALDRLNLAPSARTAALALLAAHPEVVFTSGRRDAEAQALAMAGNVALNRRWIAATYRASAERDQLQAWVDAHPEATTRDAIAAGLLLIMETWGDAQRARLSRHFAGLAFDVRPVAGAAGEAIKATIRKLPGLVKFLEKEGGLVRWHAEFAP
jgi:hypothetical protein